MKQERSNLKLFVIWSPLLLIALYLVWAGSNTLTPRDSGKPPKGEPIQSCVIPDKEAIVRLYIGFGSHATTSDSYSVTYQGNASEPERRIFYSYSSLGVSAIQCERESVKLLDFHREPYDLDLNAIQESLIQKPIIIQKMCLRTVEYKNIVDNWDFAHTCNIGW